MRNHHRGFTLIEAALSISLTALAGTVLLLAVESSLNTTRDSVNQTVALGMAQQLLDEALGARYMAVGGDFNQYPLCASSWELAGKGRERYDDTDDFNGYVKLGAKDRFGLAFGTGDELGNLRDANFVVPSGFFQKWRQKIDVYYVSSTNLSVRLAAGKTSPFRAVEVTISHQQQDGTFKDLAKLRRVISYVPSFN